MTPFEILRERLKQQPEVVAIAMNEFGRDQIFESKAQAETLGVRIDVTEGDALIGDGIVLLFRKINEGETSLQAPYEGLTFAKGMLRWHIISGHAH